MKKLLKFSSPFCGPCKTLASNLQQVDHDYYVEDINILDNLAVAQQYGIRGVPVLVKLDENGQEVSRLTGSQTPTALAAFLGGKMLTEVYNTPDQTLLG